MTNKKSGNMKAWNPQQLDDTEQVPVIEEDPSPVSTDEFNEELFTQADHLLVAASPVHGQMVVTVEEHLPYDRQQDEAMIVTLSCLVKSRSRSLQQIHHHSSLWFPQR